MASEGATIMPTMSARAMRSFLAFQDLSIVFPATACGLFTLARKKATGTVRTEKLHDQQMIPKGARIELCNAQCSACLIAGHQTPAAYSTTLGR
jgi:hypothetical protein